MSKFCKYCGTAITDGAKFCKGCGQTVAIQPTYIPPIQPANAPSVQPVYQQQSTPPKKGGGKMVLIAVLVGLAAAALIITGILVVPKLLGGGDADGNGQLNNSPMQSPDVTMDGSTTEVISETIRMPEQPLPFAMQQDVTVLAVQQYITAQLYLEALTEFDIDVGTIEEFAELYDGAIEQFELAEAYAAQAARVADMAQICIDSGVTMSNVSYSPMQGGVEAAFLVNHNGYTVEPVQRTPDELRQWAREIEEMANNAPAQYGERGVLNNLAMQLGVDSGTARDMLQQAKTINEAAAAEGEAERWAWWANFHDTGMQTTQATKTTCKVALLVTSTVATGGTTGVLAGTALVVKGADAIVEVAAVGSTILLGENHEVTTTLKDVQAYTAPAAAVAGVLTLDFATAADKIGTIDYIAHSLADLYHNDTIMCVNIETYKEGASEVRDITIGILDLTKWYIDGKPPARWDTSHINTALIYAKLPTIPETQPAPKPPRERAQETAPKVPPKTVDDYINELIDWMVDYGIITAEEAEKYRPGGGEVDIVGTYSGTVTGEGSTVDVALTVAFDKTENTYFVSLLNPWGEYYSINNGQLSKRSDGTFHNDTIYDDGQTTYSWSLTLNFMPEGASGSMTLTTNYQGTTASGTFSISATKD